jgi:hypothetical protein
MAWCSVKAQGQIYFLFFTFIGKYIVLLYINKKLVFSALLITGPYALSCGHNSVKFGNTSETSHLFYDNGTEAL